MYIKVMATKRARAGDNQESAARRLRAARQEAGLSQEEVGKRLGLSRSGYAHLEDGSRLLTLDDLAHLSRILSRPVEYFLGLDTGLTGREERVVTLFRLAESAGYGDVVIGAVHALVAQLLHPPGEVGQAVRDKS